MLKIINEGDDATRSEVATDITEKNAEIDDEEK